MKYLLLTAALAMCACCPKNIAPTKSETVIYKDSIREILRDTTIFVQVEKAVTKNVLIDTDTSVLENKFAKSTAFTASGKLFHDLQLKAQDLPVQIKYVDKEVVKTEYKETIVTKTVEVNKLTKMQSFWIILGRAFGLVLSGTLIYLLIKLYKIFKI